MYKVVDTLTDTIVSKHKSKMLAYKKMSAMDRKTGQWARYKVVSYGA